MHGLSHSLCCCLLCPTNLATVFSKDEVFIKRAVEASLPLAALVVSMNLTVALEARTTKLQIKYKSYICLKAIVSSLGKTRHLLVSGLIGSWLGQVPVCFIFSTFWRNDIIGKTGNYLYHNYPPLTQACSGVWQ